ncbi:FtsB family cell division protein [Enterococcus aquimarinus]|uniref:Cell division protein DivIC n=1 Tax=Enterococcus aquimarinus TaxID=328396 RepID=A0A1L8QU96_9ENTE|nr:septum formation initiator family protein [Enterococcus aquimarinus]OJG11034.1 cell division protein DivIC [Enterococcus aquimarinus]
MSQEEQTNLQFLDNEYAQQHYAVQAKKRREIIFRRRRLAVFFSLAAVIFVSIGISLYNDSLRLQNLERYKEETIAEQQAIKENKAALEQEVALLQDEDYVAKIARERFLYSKEGELVFPLPGTEVDTAKE